MGRFPHRLLLVAALVGASLLAPGAIASAETRTFDSFADLRAELLNVIGGASKRLWLQTDYLTDGEVVSALYVSQYRKLDVQVLLGRAKANFYMSRLNYLKNQSIPVFLRPDSFKPGHPTSLLADDKLVHVEGELDFMAKYKKYTLTVADQAQTQAFATAFAGAANLKVPAVPRPIPLVGKPSAGRNRGGGAYNGKAYMGAPTPHYDKSDATGAYTYDRHQQPRPDGVPAKLPKELKWEQRTRQRPTSAASSPAGEDEPPPALKDDMQPKDGG